MGTKTSPNIKHCLGARWCAFSFLGDCHALGRLKLKVTCAFMISPSTARCKLLRRALQMAN